jgi:predicted PurR-regulated permease PerM
MSSVTVTADPPPRRLGAPTPRVALVIVAAVVIGVFLYLGRSALLPFLVGALLIYVLDPVVTFLVRRRIGRFGLPRWVAVLVVYAITLFLVIEGLVLLLVPVITQLALFISDLPRIFTALEAALAQLRETYQTLDLPPALRQFIDNMLADLAAGAPAIDLGGLIPLARTVLGTVASLFGFIIIPIWAFYLLRDRPGLTVRLMAALPPAWRADVWAVLVIFNRVIGRWIRAQIVLGVIVGAATYVGLLLLGNLVDPRFLQFAVLLAVVAGVLELLPIIGPILAMIPTLLIALTTADPVVAVLSVVVLYTVVQQVENAVLVPKIQGDALELHPSVIIFVLIVGAAIAGLPGAIFSIPLTAAARNIFRYLFRRLSEDDPGVPPVDAPDLAPLIEDGREELDLEAGDQATDVAGTNADSQPTEGHLSAPRPAGNDEGTQRDTRDET